MLKKQDMKIRIIFVSLRMGISCGLRVLGNESLGSKKDGLIFDLLSEY
jgi:hypothetical protein